MRIQQFGPRVTLIITSLAIASIAGCAASPVAGAKPTASPAPSASSAPAASPTPAPVTAPERVFDGSCAAVPAADLSVDFGVTVTPLEAEWDRDPEYIAVAHAGGIRCVWGDSPAADSVWLSVVVLPTSVLGEPDQFEPECTEGYGCVFSADLEGFSLFGVLVNHTATVDATTAAYEAVSARFSAAVSAEEQPAPYAADGAWPKGVACETLDQQGLVGAAIGAAGAAAYPWGGDAEPNPGVYRAGEGAGVTQCGWNDAGEQSVKLSVLPGGAWAEEDVAAAAGATPVTVEGASAAYAVGDRLHVFSGSNWLVMTIDPAKPLDPLYPAAASLIGELDAAS
jgi:hypothetical protein